MKLATRILSILTIASLTSFYMSCKPDDPKKSVEEQQFDKINSTWALTSANDGTDRTADFVNVVLTISETYVQGGTYDYSLTGTLPNPSPWPKNGTWKFGTDPSTQIIRDPGGDSEIDMTYQISDNTLVVNFTIPDTSTGWPGGRTTSVKGDWEITFTKQ